MRKPMFLLILLLAVLVLFTLSCKKNDDDNNNNTNPTTPLGLGDLTPATAEWAIMFASLSDKSEYSEYVIGIYWVGGATIPDTSDVAVLEVNGNVADIMSYQYLAGMYYGYINLPEGENATIKFTYNNVVKVNTTLKMVNLITSANFPDNYNPAQPATFTWTLPANNEHQVAGVSAYKENTVGEDWYGEKYDEIAVEARSYTVPANPIPNVPAGAEYTLEVVQVNYKILNKIALMSLNGAGSYFIPVKGNQLHLKKYCLNVLKALEIK